MAPKVFLRLRNLAAAQILIEYQVPLVFQLPRKQLTFFRDTARYAPKTAPIFEMFSAHIR